MGWRYLESSLARFFSLTPATSLGASSCLDAGISSITISQSWLVTGAFMEPIVMTD
jgi:hypothetical protein